MQCGTFDIRQVINQDRIANKLYVRIPCAAEAKQSESQKKAYVKGKLYVRIASLTFLIGQRKVNFADFHVSEFTVVVFVNYSVTFHVPIRIFFLTQNILAITQNGKSLLQMVTMLVYYFKNVIFSASKIKLLPQTKW